MGPDVEQQAFPVLQSRAAYGARQTGRGFNIIKYLLTINIEIKIRGEGLEIRPNILYFFLIKIYHKDCKMTLKLL